jgi:hypothetical protein
MTAPPESSRYAPDVYDEGYENGASDYEDGRDPADLSGVEDAYWNGYLDGWTTAKDQPDAQTMRRQAELRQLS